MKSLAQGRWQLPAGAEVLAGAPAMKNQEDFP
jgi:hypothetical protein